MNLITVATTAEGSVQTQDGITLQIPADQIPDAVRGRPVILGIRPEHIHLNSQGIPAEVEMIETLGSEQLLHARCGQSPIVVRCPTSLLAATPFKPGDSIQLGSDGRHALHWFDVQTGRRI